MHAQRAFLVSTVLAMFVAGTATAATGAPERGSFDNGYESFVDTEVCAAAPWQFDVHATQHEFGTYEVWFAGGEFVRAIVHWNYDGTISANGKTIVERDTWTSLVDADGSRNVGLTVHIQGPGGIVVRDAGRVTRDSDGNLQVVNGPHEQLFGESFCPAIAP